MNQELIPVNKALSRCLLIYGVEKKFMAINGLLSFPLLAASHFHCSGILISSVLFICLHMLFRLLAQHEPQLGVLIQRASRFCFTSYYASHSHPSVINLPVVITVPAL